MQGEIEVVRLWSGNDLKKSHRTDCSVQLTHHKLEDRCLAFHSPKTDPDARLTPHSSDKIACTAPTRSGAVTSEQRGNQGWVLRPHSGIKGAKLGRIQFATLVGRGPHTRCKALVDKAHRNGAVPASTASLTCETMPLIPPLGFVSAVDVPICALSLLSDQEQQHNFLRTVSQLQCGGSNSNNSQGMSPRTRGRRRMGKLRPLPMPVCLKVRPTGPTSELVSFKVVTPRLLWPRHRTTLV